jgi:anti-sigma-K factor RskA
MKHLQSNSELQEKALLYAIGALSEDERRDYVRHLEDDDCGVCVAESLEFQNVAQALALSLPVETPSDTVKARLLLQVRAESGTASVSPARPSGRTQRNPWQWLAWPIAAAAVIALAVTFTMNVGLRRQVDALTDRVVELEDQAMRDQTQLVSLKSLIDPQVRVVNLAGQGSTPQAKGRIFWDQGAGLWRVYLASLPQVSSDRAYQLWFVPQQGNPIGVDVFNTNPDGSAMLEIQLPQQAMALKAAAITTEPAGGLPQPSGAFVLLGTE